MEKAGKMPKVSKLFVYKWHRRFLNGRDSVLDDERLGRIKLFAKHWLKKLATPWKVTGASLLRNLCPCLISVTAPPLQSYRIFRYEQSLSSLDTRLLTEDDKAKRVQLSRAFLRYNTKTTFYNEWSQLTKHGCTITIPRQSNSHQHGKEKHHHLP